MRTRCCSSSSRETQRLGEVQALSQRHREGADERVPRPGRVDRPDGFGRDVPGPSPALGEQDGTLSDLVSAYSRYAASGEINSTVPDAPAKVDELRAWAAHNGAEVDELDGITVTKPLGR